MSRLAAGVWVQAYLMRLQIEGIPCYVLARGDATAGTVWVKVATLDGRAQLWERIYDLQSESRRWTCTGSAVESDIDSRIARERGRDSDLWVLEVESAAGRHLLEDPSLE